jgi:mannitol/fructose-specific phosphotransferase system IIA component (Ntr-type)
MPRRTVSQLEAELAEKEDLLEQIVDLLTEAGVVESDEDSDADDSDVE